MHLFRSEQLPPVFTPGLLWGRALTQLQSLTKTDSGITVTYSLVLLKLLGLSEFLVFPQNFLSSSAVQVTLNLASSWGPVKRFCASLNPA